jgi:hypothetical protein
MGVSGGRGLEECPLTLRGLCRVKVEPFGFVRVLGAERALDRCCPNEGLEVPGGHAS